MLRKTDKVFLESVYNFNHIARPVAAISMYNAASREHVENTAGLVHKNVEALSSEKAREEAGRLGTATRVQAAVLARLHSEAIAGAEDLGALCVAIQKREEESIFQHYSNSFNDHGPFFEYLDQNYASITDLGQLLGIPTLAELKEKLGADDFKKIEQTYNKALMQIKGAARLYRMPGESREGNPSSNDVVFVVTDVVDIENPGRPGARGILVRGHNKTKHRFLVFEDPEPLLKAIEEDGLGLNIGTVIHSKAQSAVDDTYKIIMGIAQCQSVLAGILLLLAEQGLL